MEANEKAVIKKRKSSLLKRSITWSDSVIEEESTSSENSAVDEDTHEEDVIAEISGVGEDMDIADDRHVSADVIPKSPDVSEDMDSADEGQVYEFQIRRKTEDAAADDKESSEELQHPGRLTTVLKMCSHYSGICHHFEANYISKAF